MRESLALVYPVNALTRHFCSEVGAVALLLFMFLASAHAADVEIEVRGVKRQGGEIH